MDWNNVATGNYASLGVLICSLGCLLFVRLLATRRDLASDLPYIALASVMMVGSLFLIVPVFAYT